MVRSPRYFTDTAVVVGRLLAMNNDNGWCLDEPPFASTGKLGCLAHIEFEKAWHGQ